MRKNDNSGLLHTRVPEFVKNDFQKLALLNHTSVSWLLKELVYESLNLPFEDGGFLSKCIVCGRAFKTNTNFRKFCSYECRKKNNLALRKAWEFKNKANGESLLTPKDIIELKSETKCFYCGCELNDSNRTIDHFIPLSRGGSNVRDNLVACCFGCNNKKGQKTYEEFMNVK